VNQWIDLCLKWEDNNKVELREVDAKLQNGFNWLWIMSDVDSFISSSSDWRILHNGELHNLYPSPYILRVTKSRRIKRSDM
jgi:hypothetical protein